MLRPLSLPILSRGIILKIYFVLQPLNRLNLSIILLIFPLGVEERIVIHYFPKLK